MTDLMDDINMAAAAAAGPRKSASDVMGLQLGECAASITHHFCPFFAICVNTFYPATLHILLSLEESPKYTPVF